MEFLWPMLLSPSKPFSHEDWIFEWKADGIRLEIIYKKNSGIQCFTRHKTNCTKAFPELQALKFEEDVILDGELIAYDPEEKRDMWELVMNRFHIRQEQKIVEAAAEIPCTFIAFDILHSNRPLLNEPLFERKRILNETVQNTLHIQKTSFVETEGELFFEQISNLNLEGMCAKLKSSKYTPGKRVDFWKKIVRYMQYDVIITGYRLGDFGLLCSFITENGLKPAGVIELASGPLRKEFFRKAYGQKLHQDRLNAYLKDGIKARVKTRGLTKKGYLRTPVLEEIL